MGLCLAPQAADGLPAGRGEAAFQVAEVTLGRNGDGLWEVVDGVADGDTVVVSAQFLIDSESNLTQAIRTLDGPAAYDPPAATPDAHGR